MMEVKTKPHRKELLNRLMQSIDEDEDLKQIVNDFWKEKATENETERFSDKMKDAFDFLNKVYKYHEFNRRDGSLIDKVLDTDGEVILDRAEVNRPK